MTFSYYGFKIPKDLANLTGAGGETFKLISDGHINNLKNILDIQPHHDIFELGSGVGRDAIPLSEFITTGSYLGVDIIKQSIDWCINNVTSKRNNIKFAHLDVKDQIHNPGGKLPFQLQNFPVGSESIDRVFAFSVFTHLFESDILHALNEIKRILRIGGLAYLTCFKLSPEIISASKKNKLNKYDLNFEYKIYDGCYICDPQYPTGAIGYTEEKLVEIVNKSGLKFKIKILSGGWSGYYANCKDGQDVLVLEKN